MRPKDSRLLAPQVYAWRAVGGVPASLSDACGLGPSPQRAASDAVRATKGLKDRELSARARTAETVALPPSVRRRARYEATRAVGAFGVGNAHVRTMLTTIATIDAARAAALRSPTVARLFEAPLDPSDVRTAALRVAKFAGDDRPPPRCARVPLSPHIAMVAAGETFVVALSVDGRVYSFDEAAVPGPDPGARARARDVASAEKRRFPATDPKLVDAVRDVSWVGAGAHFAAALDDEGVLYVWGRGDVLGRDAHVKAPMPVWPLASRRVLGVAAGDGHILARTQARDARYTRAGHAHASWFQRRRRDRPPLCGSVLLDDPLEPPDPPRDPPDPGPEPPPA